mmetsp:Transcript_24725/g.37056  ORF Transcript_24725/g.37056 Transcript_24725/m.37056 type:complete len:88 (-) Transcript_24725:1041-1304(-)
MSYLVFFLVLARFKDDAAAREEAAGEDADDDKLFGVPGRLPLGVLLFEDLFDWLPLLLLRRLFVGVSFESSSNPLRSHAPSGTSADD